MVESNSNYLHGGAPQSDLSRLGLPERPVRDFSVNLNFQGPPTIVREKWPELLETIQDYPAIEGNGIATYYREKFGISRENFLSGNGSTEMIYLAPRVLRFRRALVISPSYHDYERASILAGAGVARLHLSPEDGFGFPGMDVLADAMKEADALWIGRPNNPTGTMFPKELLLEAASRFEKKLFIVDEAFIQFTERWQENTLLTEKPRPNILVIHSLTKYYALAGLRLGGVVGPQALIERLRAAKEPWTVNGIADRIAPLLLKCADYERKTHLVTAKERERFFSALKNLPGVSAFPPSANFVLCQWTLTKDLDDLIRHLLSNGMYVRDCRNFAGLEDNFFRVGLRAPEENDRLISVLSSFDH
ncbi:MAG: threonine-phosphate decarboxylase CobD [Pseudomonadota bacterium]